MAPAWRRQAPPALQFGTVAVADSLQRTFPLRNAGEAAVDFTWVGGGPFSLEPLTGSLQPGESATITVVFEPKQALVYDVKVRITSESALVSMALTIASLTQARCTFGNDLPPVTVSLRGVGKYPFVRPSTGTLDFGPVVVGTSVDKAVQLLNATPAACDFAVSREHPQDTDAVFAVSLTGGRLAGDAQMPITVTFTPSAPGAFTREAFVVTTPGGTPMLLTCTGTAVSPGVRCSATAVAFGPVAVGSVTAQRFVQLDNTCGDLAVRYAFDSCTGIDGPAVFEFTDAAGVVPPKGFAQIGIAFRPGTSAVYHRRVTILLADAPPLGLDLLGTGFTPKARPPDVGLPELLAWRAASAADDLAVAPCYMAAASGDPSCGMVVEVLDAGGEACSSHGVLDFGAQQPLRAPPPSRQVRVTNTTRHTLEVFWHKLLLPEGAPPAASHSQSTFVVLPEAADVEPGDTATFRVSFRPAAAATVYATRLEVYSHAKAQRSWRMADPTDTVLPPWGCALTCVGHTHGADVTAGSLLPDVRLMLPGTAFGQAPSAKGSIPTVAFPPAWARSGTRQHSVYRTITLVNSEAGRHVAWAVVPPKEGSPFSVRPTAGVLAPDAHAVLCLAFTPTQGGTCTSSLAFLLNGAPAPVLSCALWGIACTPQLALSTSLLHLRPTCVGTSTLRRLQVRNPTRLPLVAKWVMPLHEGDSGQAVLTHDCSDGFTLAGRDELDVTWTFAPHTVGPFDALAALHCWPAGEHGGPSEAQETARVRIFGDGAPCALRIEPPMVAIGALGVGTTAEVAVTVFNDSQAPLNCTWAPAAPSPGACTLMPQAASVMRLAARSSMSVVLTLRQGALGESVSTIQLVVARTRPGGAAGDAAVAPSAALEVRSIGEMPRLQVCAATCAGLSPASAWEHLRCDALNAALASGDGDEAVHVPVGVAAAGQPPSLAHFWLHNPSLVAAHWSFKLASEPEVSPERWAQASLVPVPDQDERLMDDSSAPASRTLFDLAPRSGVLEPGATVRVAVAYSHEQAGRHVVGAHFKVAASASGSHGAATSPLRLLLTGRTLRDGSTPALHGPGVELHRGHSMRAVLPPQPLGLLAPAILSVPLRSAAACDCTYALDTGALEELTRAALGFPVLRCLNPKGWIPARGATALHFAFRPVVAAPIHAAMPLLLMCASHSGGAEDGVSPGGAEVISVELSARGYHPLAPSAAQHAVHPAMDAALTMEPPPGVPGQLGALQPAAVAFPPVAPGGRATVQVRVMPPAHETGAASPPCVRFAWELGEGSLPAGATLSAVPGHGWVTPEGVICTLTLHAPTKPCMLRTTLCCLFTPADAAAPKPGAAAAPPSSGLAALRGSRAARVARLEAAVAEEEGGGGGDAEEVFAQHGAKLGRPLARPPRPPRTHVIYAATISSALKRPLALRDALPAAEVGAAAPTADVAVLDVWCAIAQPSFEADGSSAAFVDDYTDLDTDFAGEAAEEARDMVSELLVGSGGADGMLSPRVSTASVASAYSTAGTVVVDRTLEELLSGQDWEVWDDEDGLDGGTGDEEQDIHPEEADAEAVAACDSFLDAVEGLLDIQ